MIGTRAIADALLAALLAPPCAVCGRVLDRPLDGAVCASCWASIAWLPSPTVSWTPAIDRCASIGLYEGTLRDVVHALKYERRRSLAPPLARMMATQGCEVLARADCVVPVPLHRRRRRQRGFNQAQDLALRLGLPVVAALRRTRSTRPQVELPAEDRRHNVSGAFTIVGSAAGSGWLRDRVVVLVDDVTTTGATLDACARVLLRAGVREVRAVTAARVERVPR